MRLKKILNITNLATTTALTAVENKISMLAIQSIKLTVTQKLMKLKIKLLLIMTMINILLLKNLTSQHQKTLLQDQNKHIQQAKLVLLMIHFDDKLDN